VAFPLQFEFLFSFPGEINPEIFAEGTPGDFGTWQAAETASAAGRPAEGPRQRGQPERELISKEKSLGEWLSQYW